jgi:hypothetical protein
LNEIKALLATLFTMGVAFISILRINAIAICKIKKIMTE